MTKEEKIKEAYNTRYEELKSFINPNGVFVGDTDMITDEEFKEWSFIAATMPMQEGKQISGNRPKSLSGIENNNGWIKIKSKSDLPKVKNYVYIIDRTQGFEEKPFEFNPNIPASIKYLIRYCTHYKPIKKPKHPIY